VHSSGRAGPLIITTPLSSLSSGKGGSASAPAVLGAIEEADERERTMRSAVMQVRTSRGASLRHTSALAWSRVTSESVRREDYAGSGRRRWSRARAKTRRLCATAE
jgi:hypothetical protein